MPPRIVEAFDIVKDICSGLSTGPILPSIGTLSFQHSEEALSRCIVCATADSTHRTDYVVASEELLVFITGELGPSDALMFVKW